jgi:hypothetical protein
MRLRQRPSFYDPKLRTVAVLDFVNETPHPDAGRWVTNRLVAALKANGTYDVVGPRELAGRLAAAGLTWPAEGRVQDAAARLRRLGGIQAFLAGGVTAFTSSMTRYMPGESPGEGVPPVHLGRYRPWSLMVPLPTYGPRSYAEAHVAAGALFYRVADGRRIHATPRILGARVASDDFRGRQRGAGLAEAVDALVEQLVRTFAITWREVTFPARHALRTARRRGDGTLKYTDGLRADEAQLHVVVALPPEAAGHSFRLAVVRKGSEEVLAEEHLLWPAGRARRTVTFSPRALADAAGAGTFHVKLYSGPHLVLQRDVEIGPA